MKYTVWRCYLRDDATAIQFTPPMSVEEFRAHIPQLFLRGVVRFEPLAERQVYEI